MRSNRRVGVAVGNCKNMQVMTGVMARSHEPKFATRDAARGSMAPAMAVSPDEPIDTALMTNKVTLLDMPGTCPPHTASTCLSSICLIPSYMSNQPPPYHYHQRKKKKKKEGPPSPSHPIAKTTQNGSPEFPGALSGPRQTPQTATTPDATVPQVASIGSLLDRLHRRLYHRRHRM
jgi:hypothetical protein